MFLKTFKQLYLPQESRISELSQLVQILVKVKFSKVGFQTLKVDFHINGKRVTK